MKQSITDTPRATAVRGMLPDGSGRDGPAIVVRGLSKRYGSNLAVDDLSFEVNRGTVTAFLGPNGAGKTTTIRVLLGLAPVDTGEALVLGVPYRQLDGPARRVGSLIDGADFHPGRTARNHLRILASLSDLDGRRVDEVLDVVDLAGAADRKVGGFSLGMRRRLGLASALLGDPEVLVLDEPANGLDPAGIRWLRQSLQSFAAAGGTVLVSSHVLAEVAQTATDVVLINNGRLIAQTSMQELTGGQKVFVRVSDRDHLRHALESTDARLQAEGPDGLSISGIAAEEVGEAAARSGLVVYELTTRSAALEDVFMELTEPGST